jgi:hypothetical protein
MSLTKFPNGVGQLIGVGIGGAAGDITVAGVAPGDKLLKVLVLVFNTSAVLQTVTDRTSVCTIKAANTINTGSTGTTGTVLVLYAQK